MNPEIVVGRFPNPPPYYKRYKGSGEEALPPPALPSDGSYLVFGEKRMLEEKTQTLEEENLATLFEPKNPPKEELIKLVCLSKEKYKQLLLILSHDTVDQAQMDDHLKQFHLVLVNMMYLVNEMRTLQAHNEIVQIMQNQIKAKQAAIDQLNVILASKSKDIPQAFETLRVHQQESSRLSEPTEEVQNVVVASNVLLNIDDAIDSVL